MSNGDNDQAPKHGDDSTTDFLVKLAGKGPTWLRAIAVCVLFLTAATPYFQRLNEYLDDQKTTEIMRSTSAEVTSPQIYSGGQPISAPKDAPVLSANALDAQDAAHLSEHITQRMENPGFKRLLVEGRKGVIAYSVFPSDGCILINHINNGHIKSDLVRAQEPVKKDPLVGESKDFGWEPEIKLDVAWETQIENAQDSPNRSPVQGSCINPHPGAFQYWLVRVDQCQEQVFRRFADGCTHYQLHSVCNGAWDPQIHWTFCNAQHRW